MVCTEKELIFSTFILYSLSDAWNKTPADVYKVLNSTGVLDGYIIEAYDVLHTLGKQYLVEDVTELIKEKGIELSLHEADDKDRILGIYKQELENDIIHNISEMKNIGLRKAMDLYYSSNVANKVAMMKESIDTMAAKKLAKDVIRNKSVLQR